MDASLAIVQVVGSELMGARANKGEIFEHSTIFAAPDQNEDYLGCVYRQSEDETISWSMTDNGPVYYEVASR